MHFSEGIGAQPDALARSRTRVLEGLAALPTPRPDQVVLADEAGRIVAGAHRRSDAAPDPADVVLGVVAELRAAAADGALDVRAVALGIPAFIDPVSDLVVGGFNVGWHGVRVDAGAHRRPRGGRRRGVGPAVLGGRGRVAASAAG
jgi:hypothetical protein